ncbi:hypothetical protein BJ170DRAFT_627983 [Xylariales sp. AK1849]|nr:hypothetical protein BJ170DRAFT_627983 [Xylariales sp. AK1849]
MADIEYLKSLRAVRDRAHLVLKAAEQGRLTHFVYKAELMPKVADFVSGIITRDFGPNNFNKIPPHGRWQHFDVGGVPRVARLTKQWEDDGCDELEVTRRLIDLFFVSVLVDAGAGDVWKFTEPETGKAYGRSEGTAVASLYMFTAGAFSSPSGKISAAVDGHVLAALNEEVFKEHFQVTAENEIIGASSRVSLLKNVGSSLLRMPGVFGPTGRPGALVDYIMQQSKESEELDYESLWAVLQELLLPCWPKDRTHIRGVPIGDAWPLQVLMTDKNESQNVADHIQPFHKLTQWLAYSLAVPFVRLLGRKWKNAELGTGLPEYRNGGLFVDMGVLQLKPEALKQGLASSKSDLPSFSATSDVIIEWRAMTVALLDELHGIINKRFAGQGVNLTMAQVLEAGTWLGGRELAAKYRPETRSSPIPIEGDGTLF